MRTRTLGRTGVSVSEIGFGAWAIGGGWGEQKESAAPFQATLQIIEDCETSTSWQCARFSDWVAECSRA